jgi:hypothetical protein
MVGAQEAVEFNRDVRPILADACFRCHGPDSAARQADLRLDLEESAKASREGKTAIAPGKSADSELWRRISSADADEHMPPADSGKKLTPEQIDTLRRWIEQGAKWQRHWSFLPPEQAISPISHCPPRALNPIDSFLHARLAREGLNPAPRAAPATLLRRVTLDLTGLPPTPEELAAYLADRSPDAYERVVDRLLTSPRYGERMAVRWLDAARYADTSGYQSDGERHMWRWRDWVIEAFNANQPFDQFTIEQLAGDMLPEATLDQRIATGFNRNHRGNGEGGIIPEEYAVEYVVDRVETTSTVWLGLTLGCVRCHDHKFDPFTQREFYQLFAFFNNVPEKGRAVKTGNSPPYIVAPTRLQQQKRRQLELELRQTRDAAVQQFGDIHSQFRHWAATYQPRGDEQDPTPTRGLLASFGFDVKKAKSDRQELQKPLVAKEGSPKFVDGRHDSALEFDGKYVVEAGDVGDFGLFDSFTVSAWIWIEEGGGGTVISRMTDVEQGDGYQLAIVGGKLQLNIVKRWLDDSLRVESSETIVPGKWQHVSASFGGFRGDRLENAVRLFIDGQRCKPNVLIADLNQPFKVKEPLRVGGGGGPAMRFRGRIDEVRVYSLEVESAAVALLAQADSISQIISDFNSKRSTPHGRHKLFEYFLEHHTPVALRQATQRFVVAELDLLQFEKQLPTVMVMEEMTQPRVTHVLRRGQYDQPGEEVHADVPRSLPVMAAELPRNRLGLARWLVDAKHPLTGRVTVNRFWQMYFGTGLVKTVEDFGSQGEWPLHPELLDWLAVDFQSRGWDVKGMQRRIVTSHAYRQSSRADAKLQALDPENRLLARGPRLRLSVEMVRDQALAAAGLLVEQIGGPSVKPPQPAGLWSELTGGDDYVAGSGADHYRRSLYTYWKRTIPPPSLAVFDAATREFCTVRETRTNTPLQALTLLNDPAYVEAARVLAERVMREEGDASRRLSKTFSLILGRSPTPRELEVLAASHQRHLARFAASPEEAAKLLAVGQSPADATIPAGDLAALAAVCGTVLNLDEAVTKE